MEEGDPGSNKEVLEFVLFRIILAIRLELMAHFCAAISNTLKYVHLK